MRYLLAAVMVTAALAACGDSAPASVTYPDTEMARWSGSWRAVADGFVVAQGELLAFTRQFPDDDYSTVSISQDEGDDLCDDIMTWDVNRGFVCPLDGGDCIEHWPDMRFLFTEVTLDIAPSNAIFDLTLVTNDINAQDCPNTTFEFHLERVPAEGSGE